MLCIVIKNGTQCPIWSLLIGKLSGASAADLLVAIIAGLSVYEVERVLT